MLFWGLQLAPWKKSYDQPRQHIKKQRHYFVKKGLSSQSSGFSSSHVWMWDLDYKESWAPKNWCIWTVVLEKTLERSFDCKEIKLVNSKGNQSWIFIGMSDAEAETPILWLPDAKNWLIWIDPDAGKDWRQGEKGMTEVEMVGWHHWLNGHEFEQALGVSDRQGSLVAAVYGVAESDRTEWLNWTEICKMNIWMNIKKILNLCLLLPNNSLKRSWVRYTHSWVSVLAQTVKNLPAMQGTWTWSLGWEDPLKKGMATHSIGEAWQRIVHGVKKSWKQLSN